MNDAKHVLFTAFEKVRYTVDPEFDPRLLASKQCGETIKIPARTKVKFRVAKAAKDAVKAVADKVAEAVKAIDPDEKA